MKILAVFLKQRIRSRFHDFSIICQQSCHSVAGSLPTEKRISDGLEQKSFGELVRGYLVLKASTYESFTKNAEKFYEHGTNILGKSLCQKMLQYSFYRQFVAGESYEDLERISSHLFQSGQIKTMLCPPMEELNVDKYMDYLETARKLKQIHADNETVLQLKPSSIFPTKMLDNLSMAIDRDLDKFNDWCLDFVNIIKSESFTDGLATDNETKECFKFGSKLYQDICSLARKLGIPILIDGELRSSYAATQALNVAFSALNNVDGRYGSPLLYLTFQMYLKDSEKYLDRCLEFSQKHNLSLGFKLVRGAYMITEKRLAKDRLVDDPIFPDHESTSKNYDRNINKILKIIQERPDLIHLFVATHNQDSIRNAVTSMEGLGIEKCKNVKFAQIYGMCDHLSYDISQKGFTVYKSVPWGPVEDWVPYLARRASENYSAFQTNRNELPHYRNELKKRLSLKSI